MMKSIITLLCILFSFMGTAQNEVELIEKIKEYRVEENENFKNPVTSILDSLDQLHFEGLHFYEIDLKYRVEAKFIRTPNEEPFLMPTTTSRLPEYLKYGEAHFTIDGQDLKLNLYQDTDHENQEGYEDYLFLPFTDLTSGDGSYGGGRFLDAHIPEGDSIILDFNRSYNPYCAYSIRFSCPIPPKENDILVRIEAGVMAYGDH